ncbi:hypothetical protein WICMUC_000638 [Wickerhamomyces mucosus]|uniref:Kri1-like C-terminal domain-containing protein n=1 Tax=Wickerhamomyces mucosus TaxID=1378264 RepID=A0A9P8TII4_9ASCO|nr:hypothetical protein WICMUC_000638 [Wickerhamomyces mucosus]
MARKKSAAKKAREAEEKLVAQKLAISSEDTQPEKEVDIRTIEQQENEKEEEDEEEESSSEEEDDFGELITDDVENGFSKVLEAIKNNDKTLLDPNVRFFNDEVNVKTFKDSKQKPIYLKDYHRMNLLSGNSLEDEMDSNDLEKPKTYDQEKEEERNEILSEIKNAFNDIEEDINEDENKDNDNGDNDDGFLKKKSKSSESISTRSLPDPTKDEEKFLLEFANQQAWIPHKGDKTINLDRRGEEDDEDFDDAAEKFEHAYNFRYEDPNASEIISYARNQATVRRNELTGRRKKREEEKAVLIKEKEKKQKLITKKTTEKINKLTDILEQVKKEYGADINEDIVKKLSDSLLDKDFDDSKWDELLAEVFNDEFYNDDSIKPTWDKDDEIMKDFKSTSNHDDEEEEEEEEEKDYNDNNDYDVNQQDKEEKFEDEPPKKKSKKEELKQKKSVKKEKKSIKELAEKAIESNKLKIIDSIEEEQDHHNQKDHKQEQNRGRSKEKKETFKYREVSPESFGLTTREILIADDAELNEFIGLKKFAPYRPKEQRVKDRRKYAKKKQLKDWRKKVFKNENGPEFEKENEIIIPVNRVSTIDPSLTKTRKRKLNKE